MYLGSDKKKFKLGSFKNRTSFGHCVSTPSGRRPTLVEQEDLDLAKALQASEHDYAAQHSSSLGRPARSHPHNVHHQHHARNHAPQSRMTSTEQGDLDLARALQESEYEQSAPMSGPGAQRQPGNGQVPRRMSW